MSEQQSINSLLPLHYEGREIRAYTDVYGMVWWVAQDVCALLSIKNMPDALTRLDDDEKDDIVLTDVIGRQQAFKAVNEYGLYALILGSRKPQAKLFKRWVTHDVLPQIRRTGTYTMPGAQPQLPPRQPATRVEVSLQMAKVWRLLRSTEEEWYSNRELSMRTGVCLRTTRSYTMYWGEIGLVERQETFPRHLYRLAPTAEKQYARIWQHLDTCTALLINRARY